MARILFLFIFVIFSNIFAYSGYDFSAIENKINKKAVSLVDYDSDVRRIKQNAKLYDLFRKTLEEEGSFEHPFESLETISVLTAPDGRFRIITWYIPLTDGHFKYFGFFQVWDCSKDRYVVYELDDRSDEIAEPEFERLNHNKWFAAYYYELIGYRYEGVDYYTLLGWRGNNPLIRQRVIEPLIVGDAGKPYFGKQIFQYEEGLHKRIVFTYSARVSMSLNYDRQIINGSDNRKMQPVWLIIFDRLAPPDDFLEGHYQFYRPEADIFDGFIFDQGQWIFKTDIDARIKLRQAPEPKRLEEIFENQ